MIRPSLPPPLCIAVLKRAITTITEFPTYPCGPLPASASVSSPIPDRIPSFGWKAHGVSYSVVRTSSIYILLVAREKEGHNNNAITSAPWPAISFRLSTWPWPRVNGSNTHPTPFYARSSSSLRKTAVSGRIFVLIRLSRSPLSINKADQGY